MYPDSSSIWPKKVGAQKNGVTRNQRNFKILYGSEKGFHAIDIENEIKYDLYIPSFISPPIIPHQILILPESDGMELLLCYNDEGVYVNTFGTVTKVT